MDYHSKIINVCKVKKKKTGWWNRGTFHNNYNTNAYWYYNYIQLAPQLKFGVAAFKHIVKKTHMNPATYVSDMF